MRKPEGLLTSNEAARELGISRQSVSAAIKEGRLRAAQWGRFYVIRRKDLEEWKERRKKEA